MFSSENDVLALSTVLRRSMTFVAGLTLRVHRTNPSQPQVKLLYENPDSGKIQDPPASSEEEGKKKNLAFPFALLRPKEHLFSSLAGHVES